MKKRLKNSFFLLVVLVACLVILLINVISTDVNYEVIYEKNMTNALFVKVKTAATDEKHLKIIMNSVKERYEEKRIDAIWLWIVDNSNEKSGETLANAQIAYNNDGKYMIGSGDKDYIFKMEKLQ